MVLIPWNTLSDRQLKDLLVRVQSTQDVLSHERTQMSDLLAKHEFSVADRAWAASLVRKYQGKL